MLGSWNLLAYGVLAAALLAWRQLLARDVAPFTLLVIAGALFLFIVFAFTNARAWVETQTTVNRAILHMAPLLAVWMMVIFRARFGDGHLAPAATPERIALRAATPGSAVPAPLEPATTTHAPAPSEPATPVDVPALVAISATTEVPALAALPTTTEVPALAAPPVPEPSTVIDAPEDIAMPSPTPTPSTTSTQPESPATAALRLRARGMAPDVAAPLWQALLAQVPGDPEALFGLGNAASARGDFAAAVEHFSNAVTANPRHFGLLNNLGLAYEKLGRLTDAEAAYRRALVVRPDALPPVANLAQNLFQQKRFTEASVYFDQLAPHTIDDAPFNANRGVCLAEAHRYADAEKALLRAIELAPDRTMPKRDLALVYIRQRRWPDAARLLELVHAADADDLVALMMLEVSRTHIADWSALADRATLMAVIQRPDALDLPPIDPFIFLTWTDDPALHLAAAKVWMRQNAARAAAAAPQMVPYTPGQPLRMGFISSDFTNHPVTRLLLGLVERMDPRRFALYAYSTHAHADSPLRTRLATRMAGFREITGMGPVQRAAQVRDDGIHILVDLNGYTAGQANDLIAMRPAPLQVNFLGYTGTLGTAACDLIVADTYCIPAAERGYYSEEPLYVDPCYLPSDPLRDEGNLIVQPSRSEYGLPRDATVLSAFSACYKITPEFYDVWMRVLHKVPDAVLWLRGSRPEAEANLRAEAAKRGIDPARLVFAERDSLPRYMSRWRLADLMLDTFPFGAHTTVNDALFAGVPVLTLAGRSFSSRASGSQVIAAGLPELVTTHVADYEALAIELATNAQRRAELRARLRTAGATSALFDMDRYATSFADAMSAAWQRRFSATMPGPAGTG
jgi:predicted O-linked N-acetylglucosamine transferase (SPINDLY family)